LRKSRYTVNVLYIIEVILGRLTSVKYFLSRTLLANKAHGLGSESARESVCLWEYVCFKVFAIWVHMLRAGTKGQEKEGQGEAAQNNE